MGAPEPVHEAALERVIAFLREPHWEIKSAAVTREATLRGTLEVDGGRGDEVIRSFAKTFNVDLKGYHHRRFFVTYPFFVNAPFEFTWIFKLLSSEFRTAWSRAVRYEIALEHLALVAERGSWFDPAPEAHLDRPRLTSEYWDRVAVIVVNVLLIPWRLFGLAVAAIAIWFNVYAVSNVAGAAVRGDWPGAFIGLFGVAFSLTFALVLALQTAATLQHRFGDSIPRLLPTLGRG